MRKTIAILLAATASGFAGTSAVKIPPEPGSTLEIKGSQKKASLHFNLAAVPAGSVIVGARLVMTLDRVASREIAHRSRRAMTGPPTWW